MCWPDAILLMRKATGRRQEVEGLPKASPRPLEAYAPTRSYLELGNTLLKRCHCDWVGDHETTILRAVVYHCYGCQ